MAYRTPILPRCTLSPYSLPPSPETGQRSSLTLSPSLLYALLLLCLRSSGPRCSYWQQERNTPWVWHNPGTEPFSGLKLWLKGNYFLQMASLCSKSLAYFLPWMEKYPGTDSITEASMLVRRVGNAYLASPTAADWAGRSTNTRAASRKRALFVGSTKKVRTVVKPGLACNWLLYSQNPSEKGLGEPPNPPSYLRKQGLEIPGTKPFL